MIARHLPYSLVKRLPLAMQLPMCVGLEVGDKGTACSVVNMNTGESLFREYWLADPSRPRAQLLTQQIKAKGLHGAVCNLVLAPSDYKLLLVEAPRVEPDELRDAVRWRIRDLVDIPMERLCMDVFPLPSDSSRSGQPMVYAAVSDLRRIIALIALVKESGLHLQSIDVAELAMRNVLQGLDLVERGVAVVRMWQGQGVLMLYRAEHLYLSRRFDLAYAGGLLDALPEDQLALEIQRSLDYYERQMGQIPPGQVFLCGENIHADKITDKLRSHLSVNLDCLPDIERDNAALLPLSQFAYGAALRGRDC